MRNYWLGLAAVGFSIGLASVASASVSYLECAKFAGRSTWVPDQFVVARDGASRNGTVSDTIAIPRGMPPSAAKITRDTASKLSVAWKLKGLRDSRGTLSAAISYKAVLDKASGVAQVSASPLGFSEVFSGKARCAPMAPDKVAQLTRLIKNPNSQGAIKKRAQKSTRYTCDLSEKPRDLKFVPQRFEFDVPNAGRDAWIADEFSTQHAGGRIAAKVTQRSAKRTRLEWTLENLKSAGQHSFGTVLVHTNVPFKARFQSRGGPFTLSVVYNPRSTPKIYNGNCRVSG